MTALTDHVANVNAWLNFDYAENLVTSWTRMGEEYISARLRCKHMVQIDTGTVTSGRVLLPSDWLDLDFVRYVDGGPLRFRSRDEFYKPSVPTDANQNEGFYTLSGNYLIVGQAAVSEEKAVELHYYQTIPPLSDINWLMEFYSTIYLAATLVAGSSYGLDDDRIPRFQAMLDNFIDVVNEEHQRSKTSGSILLPRRTKGFG